MSDFLLREVSSQDIEKELSQIGFDSCYINRAADKFRYKNIKIFGLTPAQANILKQSALIYGADCGVNRNVICGNIEKSDVILCGSLSQLKKIASKLKGQPFRLGILADEISGFLTPYSGKTKLMGILNVTPDSFSDGGLYFNPKDAQTQCLKLIEDGADIIDIGAESTRPYSKPVEATEQIARIKPVLDFITREKIAIPVSIDTRCSETAEYALDNGAGIINDVSGFDYDSKMPDIIAKYGAEVVIQHSQGTPDIMQEAPVYHNVVEEIFLNLKAKVDFAREKGIEKMIIDPGVGFGKSKEDNFEILNKVEEFFSLNYPLMIGVSRKSLLGIESNDNTLKDSLSLAISYPLIQKGVDYLRVHNVKLHRELINSVHKYLPR